MSEETISEEQVLHNKLKFEINQELIHLMNRILELQQENSQLKDRLEKAIEYIEKNMYFYDGMQNEDRNTGLFEEDINDLLKILKGDKE